MKELKSYKCSLDGEHWYTVNALSRGSAKSEYLRYLDIDGIDYTMIKSKVNGYPYTSEDFTRMAKYRNIEFAYCGMAVKVGEMEGVIVGHNSSANLNVLFTNGKYKGQVLNCHPNFNVKYFNKDGGTIKEF